MPNTRQITSNISWVGVQDPDLRTFDIIIPTDWGTTYNAYLIQGEQTALVETVKEAFFGQYLENLRSLTDLCKIDYIILNHTEPDHTGALARLLPLLPNVTVVGSRSAIQFAKAICNQDFKSLVVGDGDTLSLGKMTLRFISAPFLHWPDSIFTYVQEEQVLFTCDAFGCHYCPPAGQLFDDEVGDFLPALRVYYQAIMGPFKSYVLKAVQKIEDLPVQVIAPSHGPVLRHDPWKYVHIYRDWSVGKAIPEKSVAIGYVSAYGFTRLLAETIADQLLRLGAEVNLFDISTVSPEQAGTAFRESAGVLIGSPTLNRDAVPPIWEALTHTGAIENRNKPAAAFGAYGWSGEAVPMVMKRLRSLGFKVMEPGLKVNFRPSQDDLTQAKEFAALFFQKL
jgi:flavorubredoxin